MTDGDREKPFWADEIMKRLKSLPPWRPSWYYNDAGNCAEASWKQPGDTGPYCEYVNNSITLIKDTDTKEVIGVIIKNVTQALEGKDPNDFHRGD